MPFPTITADPVDPHVYPPGIGFVNGQYVAVDQVKVSVLDYGFLHSDATYDTVHVWDGAFFRLDRHIERFFRGMEKLRMTIPHSPDEVADILHNCVALSGHRRAYVEMICTRGGSPDFSRDPRRAVNRFMAFAVPYGSVANAEQLARGLDVIVAPIIRIPPGSVDPAIKNYHWLDLVMGLYHAYDHGGETALLRDRDGNVAEGPGFNVFAVQDRRLMTPEFGVLPGITRQSVLDICADLGVPVTQGAVTLGELTGADEVFVTSTAGGIMPVRSLDGALIGDGKPGPVTLRIKADYWRRHIDHPWATVVRYQDGR